MGIVPRADLQPRAECTDDLALKKDGLSRGEVGDGANNQLPWPCQP